MEFIVILSIAVLVIFIFKPGGAKALVEVIFNEYKSFESSSVILSDGRCKVKKGELVFNNTKEAKLFVLNFILIKRLNNKDLRSERFLIEAEARGRYEKFTYLRNGQENWAEMINISCIGDLICLIWFVESGLRASFLYEDPMFSDFSDFISHDEFSSKVISKEYNRQCSIHGIEDSNEGIIG